MARTEPRTRRSGGSEPGACGDRSGGERALGDIVRYESRFERWRRDLDPAKWRENAGPQDGGGVLLDLGSHLVDQALTLFGPATDVYAEVNSRRGAPADDDVFIALRHANGTVSHLHASAVTPSPGPRLRVQATSAGFLVSALDPQEAALRAGGRPDTMTDWGTPAEWERGRLVAGEQSVPVPAEPGDWPRFYTLLRDALAGRRRSIRLTRSRLSVSSTPPAPPHTTVRSSGCERVGSTDRHSGYSSLRQARVSSGWPFGVRASRNA